ncbi:MAG: GAF domain-containing protein [Actinomycetota bacterium]|nr:GAF domain-containing protein [Actinomycetota bacterium]
MTALSRARTTTQAVAAALNEVRERFGWAYGSYWRIDDQGKALRFVQESGDAGDEFRRVTMSASFKEGVGLSGRAWKSRDLAFVPDLGEVRDCVRAPAAQRVGVRSGICFPLLGTAGSPGRWTFSPPRPSHLRSSAWRPSAPSPCWCPRHWSAWRPRTGRQPPWPTWRRSTRCCARSPRRGPGTSR